MGPRTTCRLPAPSGSTPLSSQTAARDIDRHDKPRESQPEGGRRFLARIKSDYDRTGDVLGSVPRGIARSAPLVTAAAILAVSFAVYATSEVTFVQQLGVGMALAVLVDATVIRGVLVPAAMRLAGRANWWAPAPLRRLHQRLGLREDAPPPVRTPVITTASWTSSLATGAARAGHFRSSAASRSSS